LKPSGHQGIHFIEAFGDRRFSVERIYPMDRAQFVRIATEEITYAILPA
jgi:hypothetical protein